MEAGNNQATIRQLMEKLTRMEQSRGTATTNASAPVTNTGPVFNGSVNNVTILNVPRQPEGGSLANGGSGLPPWQLPGTGPLSIRGPMASTMALAPPPEMMATGCYGNWNAPNMGGGNHGGNFGGGGGGYGTPPFSQSRGPNYPVWTGYGGNLGGGGGGYGPPPFSQSRGPNQPVHGGTNQPVHGGTNLRNFALGGGGGNASNQGPGNHLQFPGGMIIAIPNTGEDGRNGGRMSNNSNGSIVSSISGGGGFLLQVSPSQDAHVDCSCLSCLSTLQDAESGGLSEEITLPGHPNDLSSVQGILDLSVLSTSGSSGATPTPPISQGECEIVDLTETD